MTVKKALPFGSVLFVFALASCQKSLSDFVQQSTSGIDSITLIKSIASLNYDDQGKLVFGEKCVYDYSGAPQKVVAAITDSGGWAYPAPVNYTETFFYDSSRRLVTFTSNTTDGANRIDFQYDANSNLTKAIIAYPNGNVIVNTCRYQTINGQKVVTLYDTANINDYGSFRPRMTTCIFDDSSRVVKSLEAYTIFNDDPQYWYVDTSLNFYTYDNQGNASGEIGYYSYYNGNGYVVSNDSALYTRESRGSELLNTSLYIYRNIYWFSVSEMGGGFSESGNPGLSGFGHSVMYSWKYPVKQVQYWTNDSSSPPYSNNLFQNTFDASGLLIRAVYPAGFDSKYGGSIIMDYTYTRVKL